jgi:hypothetical protein
MGRYVDDSHVDIELSAKGRIHIKDATHDCSIQKNDGTVWLTVGS